MKLSIIIPNYNYEPYVGKAIDSALAVDWPDKEIIVVDDGSTDNSKQVIQSYGDRIQAIFQENSTQRVACNLGFSKSTGDFIIFLDSDDLLDPSIAKEIAQVATPEVSKVQFQMARIDIHGQLTGSIFPDYRPLPSPELITKWMLATNGYPTPPGSGNAYARSFLEKIFPLDDSCGDFSDSECLTAAPILGRVITIAKPLVLYRVHGQNDSNLLKRPGLFSREVRRAQLKFFYSQRIAKTLGIDIPDDSLRKSLHLIQHRIASIKLTPELHPLPDDDVFRVFYDMVKASIFFGAMSKKNRLILGLWGAMTLVSPRPVARMLIKRRFSR